MTANKLFNNQGRLELLNEVTKEGMLSLEEVQIRVMNILFSKMLQKI